MNEIQNLYKVLNNIEKKYNNNVRGCFNGEFIIIIGKAGYVKIQADVTERWNIRRPKCIRIWDSPGNYHFLVPEPILIEEASYNRSFKSFLKKAYEIANNGYTEESDEYGLFWGLFFKKGEK